MIVAGLPFLRAELTRADTRALPDTSSARQVDDAVRARLPGDPSDQLVVVAGGGPSEIASSPAAAELRAVAAIERIETTGVGGGVTRLDAQLRDPPYSDSSIDAVGAAREAFDGALVTGPSAELVDQRQSLKDHLPAAIITVVLSTVLILFLMTGSAALPFVALAMNALTVSVAVGAVVLVFQDGRFESLLGYDSQGALDSSMPILLFAIAFGLSTDYGVFLIQRIAEARAQGAAHWESIALGMQRSGRIITAAAALFAVAVGAFAFSELIYVKQLAIGTSVAVLVDATLVRALLFPAVLRILGPAAWWSPRQVLRELSGR
jgi:RND superfamily putative drug exporter